MRKFSGMALLIIIGCVLIISLISYALFRPDPRQAMTSRELLQVCTTEMATQYHIHAQLKIMADKKTIEVPANIGIDQVKNCMSSVHTHDVDGVIHVESPIEKDFTLGDFFFNWKQPFDKSQILDFKLDAEHGLKMFVNGYESTEFENLILKDDQDIIIDYYNLKDGPDIKETRPRAWNKNQWINQIIF